MEVLCEEAAAIKRTAFKPLLPGTAYYYTRGIAQDMMAPYRLWLTHLDRRLVAVSTSELDQRNEAWSTVTGDPSHWFPVSWDLFGLYPCTAAGGGILRVDYLAWPKEMLDDSDEMELTLGDQDAVILYGVYDGLMKALDTARALEMFGLFVERLINAQARSGIWKTDARAFQIPSVETPGFRAGVDR